MAFPSKKHGTIILWSVNSTLLQQTHSLIFYLLFTNAQNILASLAWHQGLIMHPKPDHSLNAYMHWCRSCWPMASSLFTPLQSYSLTDWLCPCILQLPYLLDEQASNQNCFKHDQGWIPGTPHMHVWPTPIMHTYSRTSLQQFHWSARCTYTTANSSTSTSNQLSMVTTRVA